VENTRQPAEAARIVENKGDDATKSSKITVQHGWIFSSGMLWPLRRK